MRRDRAERKVSRGAFRLSCELKQGSWAMVMKAFRWFLNPFIYWNPKDASRYRVFVSCAPALGWKPAGEVKEKSFG